jgi:hypothetical protein
MDVVSIGCMTGLKAGKKTDLKLLRMKARGGEQTAIPQYSVRLR